MNWNKVIMGDFSITATNCRLCLRNEKFQIPIFGEIGNEMQIAFKIKTCLPIQVKQDDCYPKHICYKCLASLDQSYALWKQSSESEALIRNITSKLSRKFPDISSKNSKPLTAKNLGNARPKNNYYDETDSEDELPFKALRLASDSEGEEYTLDKDIELQCSNFNRVDNVKHY
ncbi:hypothetical protein C0J52_01786 [Blattella germanica]|nr:hypothetical protein C0J52_01786 [Blattella germanica]